MSTHGPGEDPPHENAVDAVEGVPPHRPRPLRALATVLGVVVLLVAALVLVQRGRGDDPSRGGGGRAADGASASQDTATPGPESTRATGQRPVKGVDAATGIPVGYGRSEQGAESAAANYLVAFYSSDMFSPDRRDAIITAVAAPSARSGLQKLAQEAFEKTGGNLGLGPDGKAPDGLTMVFRTIPAGSKAKALGNTTATVSVWNVTLFGLAGTGSKVPVTESWGTTDVALAWTGGDWKVTNFTQHDGPAPISGDERVATAKEITDAVRHFGGFSYAR